MVRPLPTQDRPPLTRSLCTPDEEELRLSLCQTVVCYRLLGSFFWPWGRLHQSCYQLSPSLLSLECPRWPRLGWPALLRGWSFALAPDILRGEDVIAPTKQNKRNRNQIKTHTHKKRGHNSQIHRIQNNSKARKNAFQSQLRSDGELSGEQRGKGKKLKKTRRHACVFNSSSFQKREKL